MQAIAECNRNFLFVSNFLLFIYFILFYFILFIYLFFFSILNLSLNLHDSPTIDWESTHTQINWMRKAVLFINFFNWMKSLSKSLLTLLDDPSESERIPREETGDFEQWDLLEETLQVTNEKIRPKNSDRRQEIANENSNSVRRFIYFLFLFFVTVLDFFNEAAFNFNRNFSSRTWSEFGCVLNEDLLIEVFSNQWNELNIQFMCFIFYFSFLKGYFFWALLGFFIAAWFD